MQSHKINIGLNEESCQKITEHLNQLLADTYVLYLTTHNFHWNVTGPMFNSLHIMFMAQYTELWNAVDPIAERIRTLGHFVNSYTSFSKLTKLKEAPDKHISANEMIQFLISGHESIVVSIHSFLKLMEQYPDESTIDLLTQRLNIHEKTSWMLHANLDK